MAYSHQNPVFLNTTRAHARIATTTTAIIVVETDAAMTLLALSPGRDSAILMSIERSDTGNDLQSQIHVLECRSEYQHSICNRFHAGIIVELRVREWELRATHYFLSEAVSGLPA